MGSENAWISTAPSHASNQRPLRHSFSETDQLSDAIEWGKRNMAGEPLSAAHFPTEIYGAPAAEESDYNLPDIFFAGSFWAVSEAAADVLRRFDMGQGALYPVKIFKNDRKTPVGVDFYCLNFGNKKDLFLPEESPRTRTDYIRSGVKGWLAPFAVKNDDICLAAPTSAGPDIWIELKVGRAFFLSDPLVKALKKAKADKGFFMFKCRTGKAEA